jgi:hypothetical protein
MTMQCPICCFPQVVSLDHDKKMGRVTDTINGAASGMAGTAAETATGTRIMPRVRHQFGHLLQMPFEGRWQGDLADGEYQGMEKGTFSDQKENSESESKSQDHQGGQKNIGVTPSRRSEMALKRVRAKRHNLRLVRAVRSSNRTGFRYARQRFVENAEIAEGLMRLTNRQKHWGMSNCYWYLRNVKGVRSSYQRVYRIYRELELNLLRMKSQKPLV